MNDLIENIFLECRGVRVRYQFGTSRFGAALHATERGYCPISSTGFLSCPDLDLRGQNEMQWLTNMMDDRAAQSDRERAACVRDCKRLLSAAREPDAWVQFVKMDLSVSNAFQLGLFARDADRQVLWKLAHTLYQTMLNGPALRLHKCPSFTNRFPISDIDGKIIKRTQTAFEALKKFMRGEVSTQSDFCEQFGPMGLRTYNELPPRPNGEPCFAMPTPSHELDLNIVGADEDEEDYDELEADDIDDGARLEIDPHGADYPDEIECEPIPNVRVTHSEQMTLF